MKSLILIMILFTSIVNAKSPIDSFNNVSLNKVHNGDTIFFDLPGARDIFGKRIGIRVFGIDTPELNELNGKAVKGIVRKELESAKTINLLFCERGKYFRLVCAIQYDGKDLAKFLLDRKLAVPYGI